MTTLDVDGAALHYLAEGAGAPALAFAHGWCSHLGHWDAQAARFASEHRVIRWDRRGMGASSTAEPADSPSRHADDLAAIVDREGVDRVVIVGHAGGAPTALAFATAHAELTEALVLVDCRLHSPGDDAVDRAFEAGVRRSMERLGGKDSDAFFARLYGSFFGPRTPTAVREAAIANALATDRSVAIAEMGHVLTDTASVARNVRCPVLWVSAQPDDTDRARSLLTDVVIGHVVGSGHFVQVEVPDQLDAMIAAFLDQL